MGAPTRLLNISTRLRVGSADKVSIAGFIVTGNTPKKVIVRGLGPSLTTKGVQDPIADPVLELHKPDGTVITNDDWKTTQQAAIQATGIAPADDRESAIVATLPPGAYTAVMTSKGASAGTGLIEVYDLNSSVDARLANISTRGFVGTGDDAMIGGLIVGKGSTRVLIRALGSSLQTSGVNGALLDPRLELRTPEGTLLDSNDNWAQGEEAAISQLGLAPSDAREAAILTGLFPGNYTAIVRGAQTGVALVEVYDVGW